METFTTYEEPYWYLCAQDGINQVWVRLRGEPNEQRIFEAEYVLEKEVGRWTDWTATDDNGIIKLNPFGVFIVPEAAQHINGRHFSNNRPIKSGPLSRKVTQPWKGRNS